MKTTKTGPRLVVRNVLLTQYDEYLLIGLRKDYKLWEVPGGKVDDEQVLEASIREQLEETGLRLKGIPRVVGYVDSFGMKNKRTRFCEIYLQWFDWDGTAVMVMEPDKHVEWRWVHIDRLAKLAFMPGTELFVRSMLPTICRR